MGIMTSFVTPEGVRYMAWPGFAGASYKIAPDGTFNPKAKEIADAFNRGECTLEYEGHIYGPLVIDKEDEKDNQNQKTSFWRKLFGH